MANNLDSTPSKVTNLTNRQLNYNVNNTFNDEGTGNDGNHNRYNNIDVNHNIGHGNNGNAYDIEYDLRNNNNRIIRSNNNNTNHGNNGNVYDNDYDLRNNNNRIIHNNNNNNNNRGNNGNVYDNDYDLRNNNNRIIHNNNYNQYFTLANQLDHDALAYVHDPGASINEGRRLLHRLSVSMDNPTCFGLLRERNLHRFFFNLIRSIVSRHNGGAMVDANENTNANTKEVLKQQREIVNEVFNVATKWMENAPAGASLLDYFFEANNVRSIFLEDAGGYVNIENKNMVGTGIFWLINHYLLSHQQNITDEYENKAIVSLGRISERINDDSFGKEGGLMIVSRLYQSTKNTEHKTILEGILTRIVVTNGWP